MTNDTEALTERLARALMAADCGMDPADGRVWTAWVPDARAALASIAGSGWRLMPEVATEEMCDAGRGYHPAAGCIYTAMLNAAPAIGELG